ncbi:MAG TPA: hypothetical protein VFW05_00760 [Verrucomicrobiae bacterium]|nr:hypothetical protein [Verrucomicrobiae bacterium]
MTDKKYFWSYQEVADFLKENDFEFMSGSNGSTGAWIRLNENGEPDTVFELKFTPTNYTKKQISRIIRMSEIPESKWIEWFEERLNEAAP